MFCVDWWKTRGKRWGISLERSFKSESQKAKWKCLVRTKISEQRLARFRIDYKEQNRVGENLVN